MSASLLRHAIHIASILGLYLSGAMLIPAMLDLYYGHTDWQVFAAAAFVTNGLSATTFMATRAGPPPFSKKFGFLLVNVLWSTFALIGALPLWMSSLDLDFAQALFESVSAITTTGSTVIVGLDDAPPGVLMWRSLICWLGGVGIVVLGLFIIPYLRVGGMSFFKMESSDTNEKPFARLTTFSRAFFTVYVGITLLCAIGYNLTGMNRFDAINHAMSTVATGGFSTHDASFAYFGSIPLLWTATFFMTLCSLPFSILIVFVARGRLDALRDPQIFVFLAYLTVFALSAAIYHRLTNGVEFHIALAHSFFNFSSILSTAGYMSEDYQLWGPFVVMAAFIATFMGGCSGSTAGGIKAYRFIVLFNAIHSGLRKLIYPAAVYPIRYGRNSLDADTLRAILLFFVTYILLWILGSLTMAALGYDFLTSVSAVITCLSNVGPGLGNIVGPAGNFSSLKDPELYLLSLMMMMGRLEVLTVLVILTPVFWKQ